jgi:hypothetical protein
MQKQEDNFLCFSALHTQQSNWKGWTVSRAIAAVLLRRKEVGAKPQGHIKHHPRLHWIQPPTSSWKDPGPILIPTFRWATALEGSTPSPQNKAISSQVNWCTFSTHNTLGSMGNGGEEVEGECWGGVNLTKILYGPIWKCHSEAPLYN